MESKNGNTAAKTLWDLWCIVSIIGIWPRFIEPNMLQTTKITCQIPNLPKDLEKFKILQFSDLHFHSNISDSFYNKLVTKVKEIQPDLIIFTGDFICYSEIKEASKLKNYLNSFQAPYGCYAILGNHDYAERVAVNPNGDYDLVQDKSFEITQGFKRLFSPPTLTGKVTAEAKQVPIHSKLKELIGETPFKLLHNQTDKITVKDTYLNICGLGEHTLGRCLPEKAFHDYDTNYPGIVLSHNPDSVPYLSHYPGDLILCGHTHGSQVNLPWMSDRLTLMENPEYKRGLSRINNKYVYVNRGIGSPLPFRWFSIPEITLFTLEAS